jgi:hypothetical protein
MTGRCNVAVDGQSGLRWYLCMGMLHLSGYVLTLYVNAKDRSVMVPHFSRLCY